MSSRAKLTMVVAVVVSALALSAGISAALTPNGGAYLGQTAQGQVVRLGVSPSGRRVTRFGTRFILPCTTGRYLVPLRGLPSTGTSRRGRFVYYGADDSLFRRIVGTFVSPRRARGTMRLRVQDPELGNCDTGIVSWRARKR